MRPRLTTRRAGTAFPTCKEALADWLIAPVRAGESDAGAAPLAANGITEEVVVAFPGGGLFFWWQAGWVRAAPVAFGGDRVRLCGASAGALAAVCARCGVDTEKALAVALALCERDKVILVLSLVECVKCDWGLCYLSGLPCV
jgi:predicted acylesterase/phospholipase RssA